MEKSGLQAGKARLMRLIRSSKCAPGRERGSTMSDETAAVIRNMIAICRDEGSTAEEREGALATLEEAIFPTEPVDVEEIGVNDP
jgi:hypothetical protein